MALCKKMPTLHLVVTFYYIIMEIDRARGLLIFRLIRSKESLQPVEMNKNIIYKFFRTSK